MDFLKTFEKEIREELIRNNVNVSADSENQGYGLVMSVPNIFMYIFSIERYVCINELK